MTMGKRGAWTYEIDEDSLRFLTSEGFGITELAQIFGVHRSTIKRRMHQANIQIRRPTNISDADLVRLVHKVKSEGKRNVGEKSLIAAIQKLGVVASREKLRSAIRYVGPAGLLQRWMGVIKRRVYSVPFPNSLWHIDGEYMSCLLT